MTRTLVLGYGNELRGDDALGVHVARILSETMEEEAIEVIACNQLTLDLAGAVSRSERVVFVDASLEDPPGEIRCRRISPAARDSFSFSHELDPQSLLAWARELYDAYPEAVLVTMGGECFDLTDHLSPAVAEHLPVLVESVRQWIARDGDEDHEKHQHQG
jgi:hydrogenase maturation protease